MSNEESYNSYADEVERAALSLNNTAIALQQRGRGGDAVRTFRDALELLKICAVIGKERNFNSSGGDVHDKLRAATRRHSRSMYFHERRPLPQPKSPYRVLPDDAGCREVLEAVSTSSSSSTSSEACMIRFENFFGPNVKVAVARQVPPYPCADAAPGTTCATGCGVRRFGYDLDLASAIVLNNLALAHASLASSLPDHLPDTVTILKMSQSILSTMLSTLCDDDDADDHDNDDDDIIRSCRHPRQESRADRQLLTERVLCASLVAARSSAEAHASLQLAGNENQRAEVAVAECGRKIADLRAAILSRCFVDAASDAAGNSPPAGSGNFPAKMPAPAA